MKSEFASVLRGYGERAKFAVPSLLVLVQTNDPAVASVAEWALEGIDHDAATKVAPLVVRWPKGQ